MFHETVPMAKINEDWIIKVNSESKLLIDKDFKKAAQYSAASLF